MDATTTLNSDSTSTTPAPPAPAPVSAGGTSVAQPGTTGATNPNAAVAPTNATGYVDDGSTTDGTSDDNGVPATAPNAAAPVAPNAAAPAVLTQGGPATTGTVVNSNAGATEDKSSGVDVVSYPSNSTDFEIKHNSDGSVSVIQNAAASAAGTNVGASNTSLTFAHPDRVDFKDTSIAFDLTPGGHAGEAVEALGTVATGAIADKAVVGRVIRALDAGTSLHDVFQSAINSGVISNLAGGGSNEALAALVYHNVIGQTPDANTVHSLAGLMQGSGGTMSQADFLTAAATSSINQGHVDLVGLQQTGIHFI